MSQSSHHATEAFLVVFGWRALPILLFQVLQIFKGGPAWNVDSNSSLAPRPPPPPLELVLLPHLLGRTKHISKVRINSTPDSRRGKEIPSVKRTSVLFLVK